MIRIGVHHEGIDAALSVKIAGSGIGIQNIIARAAIQIIGTRTSIQRVSSIAAIQIIVCVRIPASLERTLRSYPIAKPQTALIKSLKSISHIMPFSISSIDVIANNILHLFLRNVAKL